VKYKSNVLTAIFLEVKNNLSGRYLTYSPEWKRKKGVIQLSEKIIVSLWAGDPPNFHQNRTILITVHYCSTFHKNRKFYGGD